MRECTATLRCFRLGMWRNIVDDAAVENSSFPWPAKITAAFAGANPQRKPNVPTIPPQSTSLTQFRVKHLLFMIFSFALALGMYEFEPVIGGTLLILNIGFWSGFGLNAISDFVDPGEIDERNWASQIFNAIGIFLIGICGSVGMLIYAMLVLGVVLSIFF